MHAYLTWFRRTVLFAVPCASLVLLGSVVLPHSSAGQLLYPGSSPSGEVAGTNTSVLRKLKKFVLKKNVKQTNVAVPNAKITILAGNDQAINSQATSTAPSTGEFSVDVTNVAEASVKVRIKVDGYLSKVVPNVDTSATNGVAIEVPELVGGDVTGDNVVNNEDASAMRGDWFVGPEAVDYNGDGVINSFDLAVVKSNFLKTGE